MTDQEICREYRAAKHKRAQIGILADQQLCTKSEIIKILAENGEDVAIIEHKAGKRSKEDPVPGAVFDALCNQLDEIDKYIVQLAKDRDAIDARIKEKEQEYMDIAGFIKDCTMEERKKDGKNIRD